MARLHLTVTQLSFSISQTACFGWHKKLMGLQTQLRIEAQNGQEVIREGKEQQQLEEWADIGMAQIEDQAPTENNKKKEKKDQEGKCDEKGGEAGQGNDSMVARKEDNQEQRKEDDGAQAMLIEEETMKKAGHVCEAGDEQMAEEDGRFGERTQMNEEIEGNKEPITETVEGSNEQDAELVEQVTEGNKEQITETVEGGNEQDAEVVEQDAEGNKCEEKERRKAGEVEGERARSRKRGAKADNIVLRRSSRLKKSETVGQQGRQKQVRSAAQPIPFKLPDEEVHLDLNQVLSILQATGLDIDEEMLKKIECAAACGATNEEHQRVPTTPVHDTVPPYQLCLGEERVLL